MNRSEKDDLSVSQWMQTNNRPMKSVARRPNILLRRSSCGSTTRRSPDLSSDNIKNKLTNVHLVKGHSKLPRLKSMSDIERRRMVNCFKVEGLNSPAVEDQSRGINLAIKTEPYEDTLAVNGMWRNSETTTMKYVLPTSEKQVLNNFIQPANVSVKVENISPLFSSNVCRDASQTHSQDRPQNFPAFVFQNDKIHSVVCQSSNTAENRTGFATYKAQPSHASTSIFPRDSYVMEYDHRPENISMSLSEEYVPEECGSFHTLPINAYLGMTSGNTIQALHRDQIQSVTSGATAWPRNENMESTMVDDSLTNITWLGRIGVNNIMPVKVEKEKRCMLPFSARDDRRGRPPYSYMALIQFAINSSPTRRMTLRQIYLWIEEKFPYFKLAKPGWKNSIRHNLSLHDIFVREVSPTSKSSFWTLRPDLNMRPLTLESVKGGAQHAFQACQSTNSSLWSFQPTTFGQKPLLPRLPECSQPYILLPVPVMNKSPGENKDVEGQTINNTSSSSFIRESSSLLADSGFHSDVSMMTPSTSGKPVMSGQTRVHSQEAIKLEAEYSMQEESCMKWPKKDAFSMADQSSKCLRKRPRKEPLKVLNDSLNNSLNFVKDDISGSPCHSSQGLHKKSQNMKNDEGGNGTTKENIPSAFSKMNGLSEDSFSEMMNDLGTPFKTLFSRNNLSFTEEVMHNTPPKKRFKNSEPCSNQNIFPSCSSMRSPGTPARDVIDQSSDDLPHQPTSTPVCETKIRRKPSFRLYTPPSVKHDAGSTEMRRGEKCKKTRSNIFSTMKVGSTSKNCCIGLTSPILACAADRDEENCNDFMNDLIGVVFKTPDKPSSSIQHFDSLTPENGKIVLPSLSQFNKNPESTKGTQSVLNNVHFNPHANTGNNGIGESPSRGVLPSVFGNNIDSSVFNNSFGKLLDLSGISVLGTGGCSASQFADLADVSWSNLANI